MTKIKNTLVVNLYGGPGTGKSSMMSSIFAHLKWQGVDCEIAPEYAKEVVWQNSMEVLNDQIYIFGKQQHRLFRLNGKVEVTITDSPILLSLHYGDEMEPSFTELVEERYRMYNNFDIYLNRTGPYNTNGRTQTESEAIEIDGSIKTIIERLNSNYSTFDAHPESVPLICEKIMEKLNETTD